MWERSFEKADTFFGTVRDHNFVDAHVAALQYRLWEMFAPWFIYLASEISESGPGRQRASGMASDVA